MNIPDDSNVSCYVAYDWLSRRSSFWLRRKSVNPRRVERISHRVFVATSYRDRVVSYMGSQTPLVSSQKRPRGGGSIRIHVSLRFLHPFDVPSLFTAAFIIEENHLSREHCCITRHAAGQRSGELSKEPHCSTKVVHDRLLFGWIVVAITITSWLSL